MCLCRYSYLPGSRKCSCIGPEEPIIIQPFSLFCPWIQLLFLLLSLSSLLLLLARMVSLCARGKLYSTSQVYYPHAYTHYGPIHIQLPVNCVIMCALQKVFRRTADGSTSRIRQIHILLMSTHIKFAAFATIGYDECVNCVVC